MQTHTELDTCWHSVLYTYRYIFASSNMHATGPVCLLCISQIWCSTERDVEAANCSSKLFTFLVQVPGRVGDACVAGGAAYADNEVGG